MNLLDKYNTLERPVANESEPVVVSFGLTLQQIIDVVSLWTNSTFSKDDDGIESYKIFVRMLWRNGRGRRKLKVPPARKVLLLPRAQSSPLFTYGDIHGTPLKLTDAAWS